MGSINKVAVIGAGTMGSGIAGHLSNAGIPVTLLDIVPAGAVNRNVVAQTAIERLLKSNPPALTHRDNVALITPGNVEDDLALLADADWIAEAVVERLDVKHALYERIDAVRKPGSMVSSNTSTIPLQTLTRNMPEGFKHDFCITHFFNPVRYMRLLELVAGPLTSPAVIDTLGTFCDVHLGKGVVACRDTPGFLGNRVGVYALQAGVVEAARLGLTVEEADAIMGRPMGIPKTGVFGLYDLIGIDLMGDVVRSLEDALPADDAFHALAGGIPLLGRLVERGSTGNKGGSGFYRTVTVAGEEQRQAVDLQTGGYRLAVKPVLAAANAGETRGLRALVESPDKYGQFAWQVLARTLGYAASLIPEVGDDIEPVDEAMKLGYSWLQGPFEMIDELGVGWFRERLCAQGMPVPAILARAGDGPLYRTSLVGTERMLFDGSYRPVQRAAGVERLSELTRTRSRLGGNDAASIWDVGDGIACIEFHTKANALSPQSMDILQQAVDLAGKDFQALLVHNDAPHFSVGFNLEFALANARQRSFSALDAALDDFQKSCQACKYAPFPVIAAPSGLGLGGGFEVLLHCDALQAHTNTNMGLVETVVGLIPSGGGCKELLARWTESADSIAARVEGAMKVFEIIGMGKTAASPVEGEPLRFFRTGDRATMNRDRLLPAAKAYALELVAGYQPPPRPTFQALGDEGMRPMLALLDKLGERGITTPHDHVVSQRLAWVLCGGDRQCGEALTEDDLCALERAAFISLCETSATVERIDYMLQRGKALRN